MILENTVLFQGCNSQSTLSRARNLIFLLQIASSDGTNTTNPLIINAYPVYLQQVLADRLRRDNALKVSWLSHRR
jgi:hypothetical protein